MKSENNLIITGIVATDIQWNRRYSVARFSIIHNFSRDKKPLFLDCVLILRNGSGLLVPGKGNQVRITAYLRMNDRRFEAVVKSLTIK